MKKHCKNEIYWRLKVEVERAQGKGRVQQHG